MKKKSPKRKVIRLEPKEFYSRLLKARTTSSFNQRVYAAVIRALKDRGL
jgi:hypothetical protein